MGIWHRAKALYDAYQSQLDARAKKAGERASKALGEKRFTRLLTIVIWASILQFFSFPALELIQPDVRATRGLLIWTVCLVPVVVFVLGAWRLDVAAHKGWVSSPLVASWLMVPLAVAIWVSMSIENRWAGDSVRDTALRLSAMGVPVVGFLLSRRLAARNEPPNPHGSEQ